MKIKLWTIQNQQKLDELEEKGYLISTTNHNSPEWEEEYKWMAKQMIINIGEPKKEEKYPIWSWYQHHDSNHRRPDLRRIAHLSRGTKGIRIEFLKDKKDVLLSDFELWHFPLCYKGYIGKNEKDSDRFEHLLKKQNLELELFEKLPIALKEEIEQSWQRVFDLNFNDKYQTSAFEENMIQACCWRINKEEIIKIDKFIAR